VFNIITKDDASLPKEIRELEDGSERFRRYLPFPNFVNTINDYPYPYVIGGVCWEFPCVVPSDWSAQHVQKPYNPDTVRDLKLALDAAVLKQGTFNLVFHPHGWIRNDQVVELIDHAVKTHGKKVKFLNFRECLERLNKNLLDGQALRSADGGQSMSMLADLNDDGYLDVIAISKTMAVWNPKTSRWDDAAEDFEKFRDILATFDRRHLRRDLDGDGTFEVIHPSYIKTLAGRQTVAPSERKRDTGYIYGKDRLLPFTLPDGTRIDGRDTGLRFVDVNNDGKLDCLFSNAERYSLHLFKDMKAGWSIKVLDEKRGDTATKKPVIPPFIRADGTNNGVWFHSGAIWLQNEDTAKLPDGVEKVLFKDLLDAK
jgi:hypothetical protein